MSVHSTADLISSINAQNEPMVRRMLENGVDVEGAPEPKCRRPIHHAAMAGNVEILKLLVQHGAGVMAKDADDRLPIHHAAQCGHVEAIRLLLACGNSANALSSGQMTPLLFAACSGTVEAVSLLIAAGGDVNAQNRCGHAPLHNAALGGSEAIVSALLDAGAQMEAKDSWGKSPFLSVIMNGKPLISSKMVVLLLDRGANPSAANEDGWQPIHWADNPAEIDMLVAKGADIDASGKKGNTPLHEAAMRPFSSSQMLPHLLGIGADPTVKNRAGQMPCDVAETDDDRDLLRKAAEEWPAKQRRREFAALRRRLAALRPKYPAL